MAFLAQAGKEVLHGVGSDDDFHLFVDGYTPDFELLQDAAVGFRQVDLVANDTNAVRAEIQRAFRSDTGVQLPQ